MTRLYLHIASNPCGYIYPLFRSLTELLDTDGRMSLFEFNIMSLILQEISFDSDVAQLIDVN